MTQETFRITRQSLAAEDTYRLELAGNTGELRTPGQFVDVALPGKFLRRPFCVCSWDEGSMTLYYKVVGEGTRQMSALTEGTELDVLVGLGNGFDTKDSGAAPLLCGGGLGAAPMYALCRALRSEGKEATVLLGFNTAAEIVLEEEFRRLGAGLTIFTLDGSAGHKGFVTDLMPDLNYSYVYSCGPMPMMRAVSAAAVTGAQFSLEARMACGFGACVGCTIRTANGPRRVCADGPVFRKEEILW